MRALCSESNSVVITCSYVTSVIVHYKTRLHRRIQAPVFRSVAFMRKVLFSTSCWNFVLSLCTFQLHSIQSACGRSIIFSTSIVTRPRTSAWVVVSSEMFSLFVATSSKPVDFKVYSCNVTHKQIHRHMASVPVQHHKIHTDNGLQ